MHSTFHNDILLRLQELDELCRSRHIVDAANRLCDFVTEFTADSEWKKDCMVFCVKADEIANSWKRKIIDSMNEYLNLVTSLIYDMLDLKERVIAHLKTQRAAA